MFLAGIHGDKGEFCVLTFDGYPIETFGYDAQSFAYVIPAGS